MDKLYDIIIVGGGLAGLSLSILCSKSGLSVLLLEKNEYPKHKVCGEFISNESYNFMLELGLPLKELNLPLINKFVLTSLHGLSSNCNLSPGGIGISRYKLDKLLADIAIANGVELKQGIKVTDIKRDKDRFEVRCHNNQVFTSKLTVGAFGRISGLQANTSSENESYVGVKYHVKDGPPSNTIEIHNFSGGYCGISKIENDTYCLCYLTKSSQLKKYKGDILEFENNVLHKNNFLKHRFQTEKLMQPIVTSQLNFGIATNTHSSNLKIGDTAGFIPPITGNGMSLAFRAAKVLHQQIMQHNNKWEVLVQENNNYINRYLKQRINKGIFLQNLLLIENSYFNKLLMHSLIGIPGLLTIMSKQAVGKEI
jgi:flavin-dependent dehydrogenase